ncbi:MAG: hypothetical protein HGA96_00025 [Desulfobulbaceae bacterium]|nr:hypothetical protein [Desulfobulbaceae bacterium]
MFENNESCEIPDSTFPDLSLCDIDIDFEFNAGQGAWVLVMRRMGHSPHPIPNSSENM